jgi:hypothetical protein
MIFFGMKLISCIDAEIFICLKEIDIHVHIGHLQIRSLIISIFQCFSQVSLNPGNDHALEL